MADLRELARKSLERRNRCSMEADMADYLAMWTDDCCVEVLLPAKPGEAATSIEFDKAGLEAAVGAAWRLREVLLMETRGFALQGSQLFNEFSIVWRDRRSGERSLQTGVGVAELAEDGRWRSLRDHYDASGGAMRSALRSPEVARLLDEGAD